MLLELSIRQLAVVEHVHLSFHKGFHVLTGETGAGKSIIIDALSLIAGGRGSAELVRYGCDKAEIEAMFDLEPGHPVWDVLNRHGITASVDEHLIIRREISAQGKSVSRINGQLVNLAILRETGEWLVNIHGQHEHQSLMKAERHVEWLDLFGGRPLAEAKVRYEESYAKYRKLKRQAQEMLDTARQALQMQDLYRFQAEEIAAAGLKSGEEEWLMEEKRKLGNAEKLYDTVNDAYESLYGGGQGLDAIGRMTQKLQEIAGYDTKVLEPLVEQLQTAFYQLEDVSYQLRDYREGVEFNPARLDEIENRLDLISSLRRKYGQSTTDILVYLDKIQKELALIDNKDEEVRKLQLLADAELTIVLECALELSKLRKEAAGKLSEAIERELKDLHMERTRFSVQIERWKETGGPEVEGQSVKLQPGGIDQVEFLISANPGEPLRPLSRIASGGEMSRIMLAMKAIFAKVDRIPVLVFDEVDTGVSGRAAQAIAEKMSALSQECQVFSITHLPQVACMADAHFLIKKEVEGERTYTRVDDLNEEGRIQELARMLGGVEVTSTTRHHAQEMIRLAEVKKAAG